MTEYETLTESEIEYYVDKEKFTEDNYPGCTREEYVEINVKLFKNVINSCRKNPDMSNADDIYQIITWESDAISNSL